MLHPPPRYRSLPPDSRQLSCSFGAEFAADPGVRPAGARGFLPLHGNSSGSPAGRQRGAANCALLLPPPPQAAATQTCSRCAASAAAAATGRRRFQPQQPEEGCWMPAPTCSRELPASVSRLGVSSTCFRE